MKRGIIITEGATEEEFIKSVLLPWFNHNGIHDVRPIKIQTSPGHKGGSVNYDRYKFNVELYLKKEKNVIVSSMIDFFRLSTSFPQFEASKKITDVMQRVAFLENALSEAVDNQRFVPYIQLHELEGLLFSHQNGFDYIPDIPPGNREEIRRTIEQYPNPELINEGAETAPSKRLDRLIPRYRKTLHGPIIALENGMHPLLEKCLRFSAWAELLTQKIKE